MSSTPIVSMASHAAKNYSNRCKRALLIATDVYESEGISNLPSCLTDASSVCEQLLKHGFKRENVCVLASDRVCDVDLLGAPTRQLIIDSLKKLARDTGSCDEVVVYFSGRGSLLEASAVKYDQHTPVVVPSDSNPEDESSNIEQTLFFSLVEEIADRSPYVTLLFDAPGRGGDIRSLNLDGEGIRGSTSACSKSWKFAYAVAAHSSQKSHTSTFRLDSGESTTTGAWTASLVAALECKSIATMHGLLCAACSGIAVGTDQSPFFVPARNRALFDVHECPSEPFVYVRYHSKLKTAFVPLGTINGISAKSILRLAAPHMVFDPTNDAHTGVKVDPGFESSVLQLGEDALNARHGMVQVKDVGAPKGMQKLRVWCQSGVHGRVSAGLVSRLANTSFGNLVEVKTDASEDKAKSAPLAIFLGADGEVVFRACGHEEKETKGHSRYFLDTVCLKLFSLAKYTFGLHSLQDPLRWEGMGALKVDMLLQVEDPASAGNFLPLNPKQGIKDGQKIRTRVVNSSKVNIHVQLLEFAEDGIVTLLRPSKEDDHTCTHKIGSMEESNWFNFTIRLGADAWPFTTFCVVASTIPADFSFLFRKSSQAIGMKEHYCSDATSDSPAYAVLWQPVGLGRPFQQEDVPAFFPALRNFSDGNTEEVNGAGIGDLFLHEWTRQQLREFVSGLDIDDAADVADRLVGKGVELTGRDMAKVLGADDNEAHALLRDDVDVGRWMDRKTIIKALRFFLRADGGGKRAKTDA